MVRPTDDKLLNDDTIRFLTRLLIQAARNRSKLTYGEAAKRLEEKFRFSRIFRTRMGPLAGTMMDKILEQEPLAPLLNMLLVRKDTGYPGKGVQGYLIDHYPKRRWLKQQECSKIHRDRWRGLADEATEEAYNYGRWDDIYNNLYGNGGGLPEGKEKDGLRYGRKGEGENHKSLRLWVEANPDQVEKRLDIIEAETEVELLSGDRVDVVYRSKKKIVAIEVKSRDSNWADLRRGIYQCIKYKAVLGAQENRSIRSLLVTERELDDDLEELADRLGVKHLVVLPRRELE